MVEQGFGTSSLTLLNASLPLPHRLQAFSCSLKLHKQETPPGQYLRISSGRCVRFMAKGGTLDLGCSF